MQISISQDHINYKPVNVSGLKEVAQLALTNNVSTGIFKNNYRNIKNFEKAYFIGLDVDDGMTIEEAKQKFKEFAHAILPTRNHKKEKNGKVADRFRVFLKLETPIYTAKDFYETWASLKTMVEQIDPAAKDPSRQFFKSTKIEEIQESGKSVPVKKWIKKEKPEIKSVLKGKLSRGTLEFLTFGAENGLRNASLYKCLRDLYQNGYNKEDSRIIVQEICDKIGLDEQELEQTLGSAFSRDPSYDPRIEEGQLNFINLKEFVNKKTVQLDWIVDKLFSKGAVSLIAGPPKAGKSTLIRQLAISLIKGDRFLGRQTTKSRVAYLALEEQEEVLQDQYKRFKIKSEDLFLHIGPVSRQNVKKNLIEFILTNKIDFVIIDTLMLFSSIKNSNDYNEVNDAMEQIREIARETKAHVLCVHHSNKSVEIGSRSIMGSTAIPAGVDVVMVFRKRNDERYLHTEQRAGKPFYDQELDYDVQRETYSIVKKKRENKNENDF